MIFEEYKTKHPLTKMQYHRKAVDLIREHAFKAGMPDNKMTRSQKQNAYMWGVVYKTIGAELGYLPEEIHQLMQKQFLSYENLGEKFVKSTTRLNTKQMEEYLENVRRFASMELNILVMLPNETEWNWSVK
jgi:hypothetical protein